MGSAKKLAFEGAEQMYKDSRQLRIEDYVFPYGKLDPENDWVKLAALVPWDIAEERYAAQFVNNGHPAHPCRMALGALLIQRRLKCSDVWLVKHIGENSYLHYFIKTWQIFLPTFRFGRNKSAQSGAGEAGTDSGQDLRKHRGKETEDVPQARPA